MMEYPSPTTRIIPTRTSYQRKGIGSSLLKKVLNEYANVYQKVLLTENQPETINFYKSLGFVTVADLECVAFIQHS